MTDALTDPYWRLRNDAYIWCAEVYCGACVRPELFDRDLVEADANRAELTAAGAVQSAMRAAGYSSEREYDSAELPKGPFEDGGGEADTPQHCCSCHKFLENPLTEDGYAYLIEELNDHHGDAQVEATWRDFYANDDYKGHPVHTYLIPGHYSAAHEAQGGGGDYGGGGGGLTGC